MVSQYVVFYMYRVYSMMSSKSKVCAWSKWKIVSIISVLMQLLGGYFAYLALLYGPISVCTPIMSCSLLICSVIIMAYILKLEVKPNKETRVGNCKSFFKYGISSGYIIWLNSSNCRHYTCVCNPSCLYRSDCGWHFSKFVKRRSSSTTSSACFYYRYTCHDGYLYLDFTTH